MNWIAIKDEAARLLFEEDALHIYAALIIQIMTARLTRRSLGHKLPWLAVLAAELVNEWIDVAVGGEPRLMAWQIVSAAHDLLNTLALPTVLLCLVRSRTNLFDWKSPVPEREMEEQTERVTG